MTTDRKSRVPQYTFSTTLDAQIEELQNNPLLQRMKASRRKHSDPHRPRYHYVNPEGTLNDPNGLCFWQGNWHLFYQAYPPEDPRQHWGHAMSKDLINWEDLPYCIYPDPEECCFSGATLVEDDRVIAMYHGTKVGNMVAISSDPLLLNWEKVGNTPVIPFPPESTDPPPYNVFDPCIWREGDYYYSLSAGREPKGPGNKPVAADFLFRSKNLANWEFLHSFIEGDRFTRVGDDGACPYFWPIGDRHILLFFSHMSGGQYLLGDYDKKQQKFIATYGEKFNFGAAGPCGVHAPSATPNSDGTVTVIFNMNPGKRTEGWDQIMTLPRTLSIGSDGDSVDMKPAGDIESIRGNCTKMPSFELPANQEILLDGISGNSYELQVDIDDQGASAIELNVLRSQLKEEFTRIIVYRERGVWSLAHRPFVKNTLVTLDNACSSVDETARARPPETASVRLLSDESIRLRIFVDRSVVEVFINERRCVAERAYPVLEDSVGISLKAVGRAARIERLQHWEMQCIY